MESIKLSRGVWQYDPDKPLGEPGGFGAVYAGIGEHGEHVAVKKLHPDAGQLAHRELKLADVLVGRALPFVVPVFDAGQDVDTDAYFIVMAQAAESLQSRIDSKGPMEERDAARIMSDIATGLRDIVDIVHRDLKPANVLFHEGRWKIADFGIARFVEDSTSLRTLKDVLSPQYAAPEQWTGERVTNATDVYALGCIGYALLTGKPPFSGPDTADFREQHLTYEPPQLKATPRMRTLLLTMLAKEQIRRPRFDRVLNRLKTPQENGSPTRGARALAEVGADLAERIASKEAQATSARHEEKRRERLAIAALRELDDLSNQLFDKIVAVAPALSRTARPYPFHFDARSLGFTDEAHVEQAVLRLHVGNWGLVIPKEKFPQSGWDVVTGGGIHVETSGKYARSASLWYTNLGSGDEYRWYEVCYMGILGAGNPQHEPFNLGPGPDADLAASQVVHTYQLAANAKAIDSEDFEAFCDRWMMLFAQAASSRLEHPRSLPLD